MATLSEDLKIVISGDPSKFNKALKEAQKQTERLEAGLSSAAKVSGVAFAALTGTVIGLVKEFRDGEQAEKQLEATLLSTGRSAQFTTDKLAKMALELQDVTTFTDDAIMAAQQIILTFNRVGTTEENFQRVSAAALDLATRMGGDTAGAARLLGQSLQDPEIALTKLRKSGIMFDEQQANTIRYLNQSGQAAKAQAMILGQVEKSVGGAAGAAATGTGAFIQLQNTFGNIAGDLGKHLAPMLISAAQKMNEFLKTVRDNEPLVKTIATTIAITTALSGLVFGLSLAGAAFLKIRAIMIAMQALNYTLATSFKVLAGATGIGLLIVAVSDLAINFDVRMKQIKAIWDATTHFFTQGAKGLSEVLAGAFALDTDRIKAGWEQMKRANIESDKMLKEGLDAANKTQLEKEKKDAATSVATFEEANNQKLTAQQVFQNKMLELQNQFKELQKTNMMTDQQVEAQLTQEHLNKTQEMLNKHRMDMAGAAQKVARDDLQKRLDDEKLYAEEVIKYGEALAKARAGFRSVEMQGAQEMLGNLSTLMSTNNKRLFKLGKAAAIANAVINTAQGVTKALSMYPPPLSIAMAAAQAAAGAVQIGQIKNQQMQGMNQGGIAQGGIPGRDSIPTMLTPGELVVPTKNYDEVMNAVTSQRMSQANASSGSNSTTSGGGSTQVDVKIGFTSDAFKIIEKKLVERRAIGVGAL